MPIAIMTTDERTARQIVQMCGISGLEHHIAAAIAEERERCAQVAEHLNGWGDEPTRASGLAEHIAHIIRAG